MKIRIVVLLLVSAVIILAQSKNEKESVEGAIDNIFELCKIEAYEKLADKIVYTGKDEARNLKGYYDYADAKEAGKIKRLAKKIKAFLDISDLHEFGNLESESTDGVVYNKIEVIFKSGQQDLKTEFVLINVGGNFLLVDVN